MKTRESLEEFKTKELKAIQQTLDTNYERTIALHKGSELLSEQLIKTKFNYQLSTLTYEADNYLKVIDVYLDILKFLIPVLFSLWTVTRAIASLSETSNFVLTIFLLCLGLLIIATLIRTNRAKYYVNKFKLEQAKYGMEYAEWQKGMIDIEKSELKTLAKSNELLEKQYKLLLSISSAKKSPRKKSVGNNLGKH